MTSEASKEDLGAVFSDDAEIRRCPFDHFKNLRDHQGLLYIPEIDAYAVARYADVLEVLKDPEIFSSKMPFGRIAARNDRAATEKAISNSPELKEVVARLKPRRTPVLVNCDPPQHMRQRRLVHKAFTIPRVKSIEPWIAMKASELIDDFLKDDRPEIMSCFAVPLPVAVIARMLGISDEYRDNFKRWSDDFMRGSGNHELSEDILISSMKGQAELYDFLREQINDRRNNPKDDLITDVINARQPGDEPFSENEMLSMFGQFLVAGNETTAALIGNAVILLAKNKEITSQLRKKRERIPDFIEEVLRLESPVQGIFRLVTQDTTIGGFPVVAGSQLLLMHGSANSDESMFGDRKLTEDFSAHQRHLAFGFGEHFCLGSGLARVEARIAIECLLEKLPDISIVDNYTIDYAPTYLNRIPVSIPLDLKSKRVN